VAAGAGAAHVQQLPLLGRKARRPSSAGKAAGPRGDHAGLAGEPAVAKLLSKGGDAAVLFSERALRVNRAGLLKPKTLLVTERHVFTLSAATSGRVSRRIPLVRLRAALLSPLADNFLALRVAGEADLFLCATFKTEALQALMERFLALAGRALPVHVAPEFSNRHALGRERTAVFTQSSKGHTMMHLVGDVECHWEEELDGAEGGGGRAWEGGGGSEGAMTRGRGS